MVAAHEPFTSVRNAVEQGSDIQSNRMIVQQNSKRKMVEDTDIGRELKESIEDLRGLLKAYQSGAIKEKRTF